MATDRDHSQVPRPVRYLLGGVVVAVVVLAIWVVPALAPNEAEHLLAAMNVILVAVLVVTTLYYAIQTRVLVDEARATRLTAERRDRQEREAEVARRIEGAVAALVGAANDVVGVGTTIAVLRRSRRIWRTRAVEPLTTAVTAASKALDQLRYIISGPMSDAGELLFDQILAFFEAAMRGATDGDLREIGESIFQAKSALSEELATMTSRFTESSVAGRDTIIHAETTSVSP